MATMNPVPPNEPNRRATFTARIWPSSIGFLMSARKHNKALDNRNSNSRSLVFRFIIIPFWVFVLGLTIHAESSKAEAERFLDAFGTTIHAEILQAGKIVIPEVGTFQLSHKEARKGRNPKTGEEIQIAARNGVTFKATKSLQDRINP